MLWQRQSRDRQPWPFWPAPAVKKAKRSDDNWSVWSSAETEHIDWQGAEPSPSQTKQRKPTKLPSSKRNPLFNTNYIFVHSGSFHEDPFVGNPSFTMNSLPAWVTAYLSGPKIPMKLNLAIVFRLRVYLLFTGLQANGFLRAVSRHSSCSCSVV